MAIQVKYFASLKERLGRDADEVSAEEISSGKASTVEDVWNKVVNGEPMPVNTLCAINLEYVKPDATVKDGDEVAFFPPVTGG